MTDAAEPRAGDVVADRYVLEAELDATEAGVLFDATDREAERRVEIEIALRLEAASARTRWTRRAMTAQRLEGEHVLCILDVGALHGGVPFVVREPAHDEGLTSLARAIATRGSIPLSEAVGWTLEACEAIAEAHALGLAHGDLRVENVYLAPGNRVKVAWTGAATGEHATREEVAGDVAALGTILRALVADRSRASDGSALPLDPELSSVAELARALAPHAPAGHGSARRVALLMSRAGIVGAAIRAAEIALPPRRPALASAPELDDWFVPSSRAPGATLSGELDRPRRDRGVGFTVGFLVLVGAFLGGAWIFWTTDDRPRTDAPPSEPVGTTEITSADAAVAEPPAIAVEDLPNAPADPAPASIVLAPAVRPPAVRPSVRPSPAADMITGDRPAPPPAASDEPLDEAPKEPIPEEMSPGD
ncbi:MAG: hypothetical protein KF819_15395 [Labilithrix sp.]|nr:hypothetical protein [Labilithrix sp.]